MSARFPPRFLKLVKAACPGVSMNKRPGIVNFFASNKLPQIFCITCNGIIEAPIACVIAPASDLMIEVPLILSKTDDFPWSTWPTTVHIGLLVAYKT